MGIRGTETSTSFVAGNVAIAAVSAASASTALEAVVATSAHDAATTCDASGGVAARLVAEGSSGRPLEGSPAALFLAPDADHVPRYARLLPGSWRARQSDGPGMPPTPLQLLSANAFLEGARGGRESRVSAAEGVDPFIGAKALADLAAALVYRAAGGKGARVSRGLRPSDLEGDETEAEIRELFASLAQRYKNGNASSDDEIISLSWSISLDDFEKYFGRRNEIVTAKSGILWIQSYLLEQELRCYHPRLLAAVSQCLRSSTPLSEPKGFLLAIAERRDLYDDWAQVLLGIVLHHPDRWMRLTSLTIAKLAFGKTDAEPFRQVIVAALRDRVLYNVWSALAVFWNGAEAFSEDAFAPQLEEGGIADCRFVGGTYLYGTAAQRHARFACFMSQLGPYSAGIASLAELRPIHSLRDYQPDRRLRRPIMQRKYRDLERIVANVGVDREKVFAAFFKSGHVPSVFEFPDGSRYVADGHHHLAALYKAARDGIVPGEWLAAIPTNITQFRIGRELPDRIARHVMTLGVDLTWEALFPVR